MIYCAINLPFYDTLREDNTNNKSGRGVIDNHKKMTNYYGSGWRSSLFSINNSR